MKRWLKITLLSLLIVAMQPVHAMAATEKTEAESTIYLKDGSYITIELSCVETRASGTKTASKTYTYRGNDGAEAWRAVLEGTFTYNGTTATCTASSCDVTITDTAWHIISKTANKSGSSAVGELTMGRKWLGITINKETVNMRITCDANGNLS